MLVRCVGFWPSIQICAKVDDVDLSNWCRVILGFLVASLIALLTYSLFFDGSRPIGRAIFCPFFIIDLMVLIGINGIL